MAEIAGEMDGLGKVGDPAPSPEHPKNFRVAAKSGEPVAAILCQPVPVPVDEDGLSLYKLYEAWPVGYPERKVVAGSLPEAVGGVVLTNQDLLGIGVESPGGRKIGG